jgi:hypothetical protein
MPALWRAVATAAAIWGAGLFSAQPVGPQQAMPGLPAKMSEPPRTLPDSCSEAMVQGLKTAPGTPAYRSVHREIAALRMGHEASQKLQRALVLGGQTGSSTSTQHQLILVMTGMDTAENLYLCGSFIVAQGGGYAGVDQVLRTQFVPVFNRMAEGTRRLENSVVMQTSKTDTASSDTVDQILDERKQAGGDLVVAVGAADEALVDGDLLRLTCGERTRLISELAALRADGAEDEFRGAAALLADFLKKPYGCAAG